ncbi:Ig-like domain-containing protein [Ferruginibacter lapsinanis]|uniref:Ig-like domain-containing protein n=1 Tax=Ferruginibacter lapsinanis TaxID=563172 RepID=UPI001E2E2B27|nr:Ig-like domain-containing protein [Ferruginibacter lapsinanis]UEG50605.1 Ig-like domain-containing protein [Ferruginibacter lapsinanis]
MKSAVNTFYFLLFIFSVFSFVTLESGCAQIGAPTGGPKDSIPPTLVKAIPALNSTNVTDNKIVLTFDEYVDVKDVLTNVLVSPYPRINPVIEFKLKTVTVKLKDTLQPNTTYSIDFGNAIRDNNEGNPYKNFTYVFSTGRTIDTLQLSGKVIVANTGKTDSTFFAMLYRSMDDSAVQKRKPDYLAKLNAEGKFLFKNLSAGVYKLYALKDGDGSKTYNSTVESFAFLNGAVTVSGMDSAQTLYAFALEKDTKPNNAASVPAEKKFKYITSLTGNMQELITDLELDFSRPIKNLDAQKIILTDTNYKPLVYTVAPDSTNKKIVIKTKWSAGTRYILTLNKESVADSMNNTLAKSDTIKFKTKEEDDYGSLVLRFKNLVTANHPVLQFVQGDEIKKSLPITTGQWSDKLFPPGEYELRILYDTNNDGLFTPGNYTQKLQPEKVITLDKKLSIKANWDNEREIQL